MRPQISPARHGQGQKRCAHCGVALTHLQARTGRSCDRQECRSATRRLAARGTACCSVCGSQLTPFEHNSGDICSRQDCRHVKFGNELKRRSLENKQVLQQRAETRCRELQAENPTLPIVDATPVFVVPNNRQPLVPLSEERRSAFVDALSDSLRRAWEVWTSDERDTWIAEHVQPQLDSEDENIPILGMGCAACGGECCLQGGDEHAFLDPRAIIRYLLRNPDKEPEEILESYCSQIAPESYAKSCVYHGPRGCGLDRDMRAHICNDFFCESLTSMRQQLRQSPADEAFAVSISQQRISVSVCDQQIQSVAVIKEESCVHLPDSSDAARAIPEDE